MRYMSAEDKITTKNRMHEMGSLGEEEKNIYF